MTSAVGAATMAGMPRRAREPKQMPPHLMDAAGILAAHATPPVRLELMRLLTAVRSGV